TEETDNPDLRDRGYMYWRLLSTDPAMAKHIIMGEKPPITAEIERADPATLEELVLNVGTLAAVYACPVNQIFRQARPRRLAESPALQRRREPEVPPPEQKKEVKPEEPLPLDVEEYFSGMSIQPRDPFAPDGGQMGGQQYGKFDSFSV